MSLSISHLFEALSSGIFGDAESAAAGRRDTP